MTKGPVVHTSYYICSTLLKFWLFPRVQSFEATQFEFPPQSLITTFGSSLLPHKELQQQLLTKKIQKWLSKMLLQLAHLWNILENNKWSRHIWQIKRYVAITKCVKYLHFLNVINTGQLVTRSTCKYNLIETFPAF